MNGVSQAARFQAPTYSRLTMNGILLLLILILLFFPRLIIINYDAFSGNTLLEEQMDSSQLESSDFTLPKGAKYLLFSAEVSNDVAPDLVLSRVELFERGGRKVGGLNFKFGFTQAVIKVKNPIAKSYRIRGVGIDQSTDVSIKVQPLNSVFYLLRDGSRFVPLVIPILCLLLVLINYRPFKGKII